MCRFHVKLFIVRPFSAAMPSSVTEDLRVEGGGYFIILAVK